MTLETISRSRLRATFTADELSGYCITQDSISTSDSATRTLLGDMLLMIKHMGLRHFGDRVTVEYHPHPDGGCDMLLTIRPPVRWLFENRSDLLFALRSGALPDQPCAVTPKGDGMLLTPKCHLSPNEAALLSEFSIPVPDIIHEA